MDILINGMKMPTSCADCRFYGDYCYAKGDENKHSKLPCPLVPIPPHGRLGDIDKLAKRIEYERFHHGHTDGLAAQHHVAEYSHFLKVIADTPTVIEADEADMDSFIRIFEEDDEEDGMDSFIRILKD